MNALATTSTATLQQMATELRSRLNDSTRTDDRQDMQEQLAGISAEIARRGVL